MTWGRLTPPPPPASRGWRSTPANAGLSVIFRLHTRHWTVKVCRDMAVTSVDRVSDILWLMCLFRGRNYWLKVTPYLRSDACERPRGGVTPADAPVYRFQKRNGISLHQSARPSCLHRVWCRPRDLLSGQDGRPPPLRPAWLHMGGVRP